MMREDIKIYVLDYLAGRMTCKEFVEIVTDYLQGSMPLGKTIRFICTSGCVSVAGCI